MNFDEASSLVERWPWPYVVRRVIFFLLLKWEPSSVAPFFYFIYNEIDFELFVYDLLCWGGSYETEIYQDAGLR